MEIAIVVCAVGMLIAGFTAVTLNHPHAAEETKTLNEKGK